MKTIRNQDGLVILPFCLVMAAILAGIFMYASSRSNALIEKVGRAQARSYGNQLAVKFGQRLRWSYDAARADAANPALQLCTSNGGVITPLNGVSLCLINDQVCVQHPQVPAQTVCVKRSDSSLVAFNPHPRDLWVNLAHAFVPSAFAQNLNVPAAPAAASTNINFTPNPTCVGGDCAARCGVNADCVSIRFCSLVGTCTANQHVWQTIAFIR